jgi:microtubule-associated protein-like 6
MGNNISQEQLAAHLNKQEALIRQLQTVVQQQSANLAAMGHSSVNYDVDGQGNDVPLDYELEDEVEGLRRPGNQAKKPQQPVDEEEKALAPEQWTEPTEEEEREFSNTKPWLGSMAPRTGFQHGTTDALPDVRLELEYVYGYRADSVRQNIVWIDKNTIAYFAAAVGIVHNLETNTQKFFLGHSDEILCLAYHPERRLVVTGEKGKIPAIHVWSVDTCQEVAKIAGFHNRGVVSVAFNKDGSKIATVGLDDNHSIAVFDWEQGTLLASAQGDTNRIFDVQFNKSRDADANTEFVTVGVKHVAFWKLTHDTLERTNGRIGNLGERQAYLGVGFSSLYTVLATQTGELYVFKGHNLIKIIAAHQKCIYAIKGAGADVIVTGGKDGHVSRWDMNTFEKTGSINLNKVEDPAVLRHSTNYVRAVDTLGDDEVIVGTITSSIYKANFANGTATPVLQTHYGDLAQSNKRGELWALAGSPTAQRFVSAGQDATFRVWDAESRKVVTHVQLSAPAYAVAWSDDGRYIAVGLQNGSVNFFNADGTEIKSVTKGRRRIQSIRFSPSGRLVAVGTADNVILLFNVEEDFKFVGKLTGHSSVVLKIDFSKDEKYLQTCSQSYELIFFDLTAMKPVPRPRDLKDVEWASFTSILGWDVQGIWPKYSDGADVNAVTRSHSAKYLATAGVHGFVQLFNFPCVGGGLDREGRLNRRPESHSAAGHSDNVTDVAWTGGDQRVISSGGADLSIFQWKVVPHVAGSA